MPYVGSIIEDDIPIPPVSSSRGHKHPFRELGLGQSFLIECEPKKYGEVQRLLAQKYRNYPDKKFLSRRMPEDDDHPSGIRVWRIK